MNTQLPVTNWLLKKAFTDAQWISRFFVLLDSEIQIYKYELAELPLETLNLDRILEIIPQREPLCFQLKLTDNSWMIRCESESDVKLWIRAIKDRKRNKSTSLLKRRNKQLTPIIITQQQSNYSLITPSLSTSSSSLILSPPNLNTRVPPCAIDSNKERNNLIIEEDELSPTYLIYKKRFRL